MLNYVRANKYMQVCRWSYKAFRVISHKQELTLMINGIVAGEGGGQKLQDFELAIEIGKTACQEYCPSLFELAVYFQSVVPDAVGETEREIEAIDKLVVNLNSPDPLIDYQNAISNQLNRSMHAWLAIPKHKRIRALKKGLIRFKKEMSYEEANALLNKFDQRVVNLTEEVWFTEVA